ncbi:MAG: 3'-5' exonuclease [Gemmataceae bacterium]
MISSSIAADIIARRATRPAGQTATGFLIFDTESVPDGTLLGRVKYPREGLTPEEAIARARQEAREASKAGGDFLPVTFQVPVAVCVVRVAVDFTLQQVTCLGSPEFETPEIVRQFWRGVEHYTHARLVTFNGRGFDLPLMELAAYDHGVAAAHYFQNDRNRYHGKHIDLMDWLSNYGAYRLTGGLNLLAVRAAGGRPAGCGKLDVAGDQVYEMHRAGKRQEINDYCLFDTLDTYFVFLRTRVLLGEFDAGHEDRLARRARLWLEAARERYPALATYLAAWDLTRRAAGGP